MRSGLRSAGSTPARRDAGWALVAVLVVAALLLGALGLVAAALHERMFEVRSADRDLRLQVLVDSGISVALQRLRGNFFHVGSETFELNGGSAEVTIALSTKDRHRDVRVEATWGGARRVAVAEIFREDAASFPEVVSWGPGSRDPDEDGEDDEEDEPDGPILPPIFPPP
ncbi:MAG: hypothetical protein AAGN46_00150 [Acidobacteriota bacterium]